MLEKRLSEHKGAVKRDDTKSGIAVHAWKADTAQVRLGSSHSEADGDKLHTKKGC